MDGSGRHIPGLERVELRGWIRHTEQNGTWVGTDSEGEIKFQLEPDIDWEPDPQSNTKPLNTFEQIADLLTPILPERDFKDGWFHVEINNWVPARVCEEHDCPPTNLGCGDHQERYNSSGNWCAAFTSKKPSGWNFHPGRTYLWSPFDAQNIPHSSNRTDASFDTTDRGLLDDEYVRIVGTIYEDDNHDGTFGDPCWIQGSSHDRGWTEIHPVDFIARIPAPRFSDGTQKQGNGITFLSACAGSSLSQNIQDGSATIVPLGPKFPHNRIVVDRHDVREWSNNSTIIGPALQYAADHATAYVRVKSKPQPIGDRGLFRAAYRARWEACTPDCSHSCKGQSDGCDGVCSGPPCKPPPPLCNPSCKNGYCCDANTGTCKPC